MILPISAINHHLEQNYSITHQEERVEENEATLDAEETAHFEVVWANNK